MTAKGVDVGKKFLKVKLGLGMIHGFNGFEERVKFEKGVVRVGLIEQPSQHARLT